MAGDHRARLRVIRDVVSSADAMLGESIARGVASHHRRRLGRVGWSRALDPSEGLWAEGDPAPRAGCSLEVLVDGEEALPRIADEIATRAVTRVAGGLAVWPVVRAPARWSSRRPAQPAGAAGRADRCARPRVGRRSRPRLPAFAPRRPRHARGALSTAPTSSARSTPTSVRCTATTRKSSSSTIAWRSSAAST